MGTIQKKSLDYALQELSTPRGIKFLQCIFPVKFFGGTPFILGDFKQLALDIEMNLEQVDQLIRNYYV